MKKVLAIALMLLIPCTAFGMETLTIDEMAEITGQSGVAIALDDVKIFYSGSETWYQSASDGRALDNVRRTYHGAIGLISGAEMFYANAVMLEDDPSGVLNVMNGVFYSPGRPLMYDYTQHAIHRGSNSWAGAPSPAAACAYTGFNFGNTRYYGTVNFSINGVDTGAYQAFLNEAPGGSSYNAAGNAATASLLLQVMDRVYGISSNAAANAAGSIDLVDVGFASKAITIRVVDKTDIFSEALGNSIDNLMTGLGIRSVVAVLTAANAVSWDEDFAGGPRGDIRTWYATNTATKDAKIGGVVIGLPTAELYTEGANDLNIRLFVSRTGTPANPGNPLCDRVDYAWNASDGSSNYATANSWSFGKLYYNNSTTFILDGFIEITPFEAYVNPVLVP